VPKPSLDPYAALPEPDPFGNYRFGDPKDMGAPVIFKSQLAPGSQRASPEPTFMVYLGRTGFVWEPSGEGGQVLWKSNDPAKALKLLRARVNGRGR